ncbi:MAG: GntR family transcriptional regulator [Ornithinimicrobium sp.]
MITIDPSSKAPAFQQICDGIMRDVEQGILVPGAQLPTVRDMADQIGLAANTVAKAYKQLAAEGHVVTRGRNGTFILAGRVGAHGGDSAQAAQAFAAAAKGSGLSVNEAIGLLRRSW